MKLTKAQNVMEKINALLAQDTDTDQEKDWLLDHAGDEETKTTMHNLSTQDFRVIAVIENSEKMHVKLLPKETGLSQPTISRTITRFEKKDILEKYHTADNNKDILVRLTPLGMKIAQVHQSLDERILQRVNGILEPYSKLEIEHFNQMLKSIKEIKL